jgi:hypothetical protein
MPGGLDYDDLRRCVETARGRERLDERDSRGRQRIGPEARRTDRASSHDQHRCKSAHSDELMIAHS